MPPLSEASTLSPKFRYHDQNVPFRIGEEVGDESRRDGVTGMLLAGDDLGGLAGANSLFFAGDGDRSPPTATARDGDRGVA